MFVLNTFLELERSGDPTSIDKGIQRMSHNEQLKCNELAAHLDFEDN